MYGFDSRSMVYYADCYRLLSMNTTDCDELIDNAILPIFELILRLMLWKK